MEFLPCPFCGSDQVSFVPSLMAADYVECRECWAHGPIIFDKEKTKSQQKESALYAWNLRNWEN
jgi:Lar family restriction alleviation protein